MKEKDFDAVTRKFAENISRREALKLISGFAGGSVLALLGVGCGSGSSSNPGNGMPDPPAPPALEFTDITAADLQSLTQQAETNEDFAFLRNTFEEVGYTAGNPEGIMIRTNNNLTAEVLSIPYQPTEAADSAFLVYGLESEERPIVVSFRYESATSMLFGFYRNLLGGIDFEVIQSAGNDGGNISQTKIKSRNRNDLDESCQTCVDTCTEVNRLRANSCLIASIGGGINVGISSRATYRELAASAGNVSEDLAAVVGHINAIKKAGTSLLNCLIGNAFDCNESGAMCRDLCNGCSLGSGAVCSGAAWCVDNECRTPCGDIFCDATEVCSAADQRCIPLEDTCPEGTTYMDTYRAGFNTTRFAPACCAIPNGINCGATTEGTWGGCCPQGTECRPTGIGYGCFQN